VARKTANMVLREHLQNLLGSHASYLLLKDETKEPVGRYRLKDGVAPPGRRSEIPEIGNYGIIPEGGFFILDLDVHRGDLQEQLALFEELFGVTLSETLVVETPSGGLHYYLRLPYGFNEPIFNGSLRSYAKHLMEHSVLSATTVDADIRSSDATGYVVGPTSHVSIGKKGLPYKTPGGYMFRGRSKKILERGDFRGIAVISEGGAELLRHLRAIQLEKRAPKEQPVKEGNSFEEPTPQALMEHVPSQEVLARISYGLSKKIGNNAEYHRRRSFVLAALRCCYSDYAIAAACVKLGIDRDTYTEERQPFWETLADMKGLRIAGPAEHTVYCDLGRRARGTNNLTLDEQLEKLKEKVSTRTLSRKNSFRDPKAINMHRVIQQLDQGTPKVPQKVRDAVLIMDVLFQPLLNVGATRVVVARTPVAEALGISEARVAEAMRLLRAKSVVELRNRQRTGLASTYSVAPIFIHKLLTGHLKYRWSLIKEKSGEGTPLLYNRFENVFQELNSGKRYKIDGTIRREWRRELGTPPEIAMTTFVKEYLRRELEPKEG